MPYIINKEPEITYFKKVQTPDMLQTPVTYRSTFFIYRSGDKFRIKDNSNWAMDMIYPSRTYDEIQPVFFKLMYNSPFTIPIENCTSLTAATDFFVTKMRQLCNSYIFEWDTVFTFDGSNIKVTYYKR